MILENQMVIDVIKFYGCMATSLIYLGPGCFTVPCLETIWSAELNYLHQKTLKHLSSPPAMLSAPKANLYTQVSITVPLQRKIQINLKMEVKPLSSMCVLREGETDPRH